LRYFRSFDLHGKGKNAKK